MRILTLLILLTGSAIADFQVGFGRMKITPSESLWMSGYGDRNQPSSGCIIDDVWLGNALNAAGIEKLYDSQVRK